MTEEQLWDALMRKGEPPRAADVRKHDELRGLPVRVALDGCDLSGVVAYDCDAGFVITVAKDENGRVMTDPSRFDLVQLDVIEFGVVSVRWS